MEPGHPGPRICASALLFLGWLVWAIFCIATLVTYSGTWKAGGAPGAVGIIGIILGAALAPVWALHIACTLCQRCLFRPRWIMTGLSAAAGAMSTGALLGLPRAALYVQLAAALTAGLSLCSAAIDLVYHARKRCATPSRRQHREPLMEQPDA